MSIVSRGHIYALLCPTELVGKRAQLVTCTYYPLEIREDMLFVESAGL